MGVVTSSREVQAAMHEYAANPVEDKLRKLLELYHPYLKTLVRKHAYWVQDELVVELQLYLYKKVPDIIQLHKDGKVDNPFRYLNGILHRHAITYMQKVMRDSNRYVKLDDVELDALNRLRSEPDHSYDHKDLTAYLRKAGEALAKIRFENPVQAKRASRWIQVLLRGERPTLHNPNLTKFNHSHPIGARHMYFIVIQSLRKILREQTGLAANGEGAPEALDGEDGDLDGD